MLTACALTLRPAVTPTPSSRAPVISAPQAGTVNGTVERVEGSALTLRTQRGNVIILLRSGATISKLTLAKTGDLAPGLPASVRGRRDSDGRVEALSIGLGSASQPPPSVDAGPGFQFGGRGFAGGAGTQTGGTPVRITGTIQSVSANVVEFQSAGGPVELLLTDSTILTKLAPATADSIQQGDRAVASGQVNLDGSLGADQVEILSLRGP